MSAAFYGTASGESQVLLLCRNVAQQGERLSYTERSKVQFIPFRLLYRWRREQCQSIRDVADVEREYHQEVRAHV